MIGQCRPSSVSVAVEIRTDGCAHGFPIAGKVEGDTALDEYPFAVYVGTMLDQQQERNKRSEVAGRH